SWPMARKGLLIDWGGVMTSDLFVGFSAFCEREGLEPSALASAFRHDPVARQALIDFECGRLDAAAFEPIIGGALGVADHGDLVARMFADMRNDDAMQDAVAGLKRAGVRTGLLSNSWGPQTYDRRRFDELFDITVISGDEGMRKPDPAIYELAAERIGLPYDELVFVDDLPHNLAPAEELGIATVHHSSADETIRRLEELFAISVR
ncbi:MAG TPA: HAD family phosphatase, partial [Solirubrobacteraceae bacterium]